MATPFTVKLPGGGSVTVNANSPEAARENAGVGPNAEVTAGGHGGGPGPNDAGSQRASGTTGGASAGTYNAGGPANPGTPYAYEGAAAPGGTEADRTRNRYERRPGQNGQGFESLKDWQERAWGEATKDKGGVLSPDSSNEFRHSPYARWFQDRYAQTVPANLLLERVLTNSLGAEEEGAWTERVLGNAVGSGAGRGLGTGMQGAIKNLGQLDQLVGGDKSGLSPDQMSYVSGVAEDPATAATAVRAQLAGAVNPFGASWTNNLINEMQSDYYDDPVGHEPGKNGAYLTNLLKRLHIRS